MFSSNSAEEINYDPKWRDYYSYLTDELPTTYYNRISEIYKHVNRFNEAISSKNKEVLMHTLNHISFYDETKKMLGVSITTNEDLLVALTKLSKNKRIRSRVIYNLFQELIYLHRKNKLFQKIESEIVSYLKPQCTIDRTEVEKKIKTWLNNQAKCNYLKKWISLDRLIYEVLSESKIIDLTWGECSLKKETN